MHTNARLEALDVALYAVKMIRPICVAIRRQDKNLEDQLRRAASSVVLNLAEGAKATDGNRDARFATAEGSLGETRVALALAAGWGYVGEEEVRAVDVELDRVAAMLWRLRRKR